MDGFERKFAKVSVIVPVYRTEAYLKECVESVLRQDYKNLEIILVDDGSPDRCPALCDEYAREYPQVKVVHQENQGPGAARNAGIREAAGDYVLFLDSDDVLNQQDAIRILTETALREKADVVTGNFRRFRGDRYGPVSRSHLRSGAHTKTVDFRFRGFLTEWHLITDCGKLYRKAFLLERHLWCERLFRMEDKLRNMMCCTCEPVYAFVDACVYLYRITDGSLTQQYQEQTEDLERDWIDVAGRFYKFLKEQQKLEKFGDLLDFHIFCGVFTIGRQPIQDGRRQWNKAAALLKHYGEHPLVRSRMRSLARGKYWGRVHSPFWNILLQGASILFCMGRYRWIVYGIYLLQGLGSERRECELRSRRGRDCKR